MFSWITSYFGGSEGAKISINGKLLRYDQKIVKTISMDCDFKVESGSQVQEADFEVVAEDYKQAWECDEERQFSQVQGENAFCWRGDGNEFNSWYIFVLKGGNVAANAELIRGAISLILRNQTSDNSGEPLGVIDFEFTLDTLEFKKPKNISVQPQYPSVDPSVTNPSLHYDNETVIVESVGELYGLDKDNVFQFRGGDFQFSLCRIGDPKDFVYMIYVEKGNKVFLKQLVNIDMNLQILSKKNAVVWTLQSPMSTWSAVLEKQALKFQSFLVACVWESQNSKPFSNLSPEDQDYIIQSCIVDKEESIDDDDVADNYVDFMEDEDDYETYSSDDEDFNHSTAKQNVSGNATNSLLIDSSKHGRCFVVRGSNVGVFKRDGEDVEYDTMMSNISTTKGTSFTPKRMMLHNQESSLLLSNDEQHSNSEHRGKVYRLDLNRGKVVEEWSAGDNVAIRHISNVQKYSEQLPQEVFTASNQNTIFGMDPRINKQNKVVGDLMKYQYKSNPNFTCLATSSDGHVVSGSKNGIIRLYSGTPGLDKFSGRGTNPKSAKTNLPAFGDEIKGVDVTGNGKWVLATCETYLLVIPTEMPTSSNTGFQVRMGKDKPTPFRLQLLPEDAKLIGKVSFTPAKFNTGHDGEVWLVTSTGPFIITWNFRHVSKGRLTSYNIKRLPGKITSEQFMAVPHTQDGRNAPILVALQDDVKLQKRVNVKHNPFREMPYYASDYE